jgi:hypothetical protein
LLVSHVIARGFRILCWGRQKNDSRVYSLEEQDVRLWLVDLVVLPAQTLCDAQTPPLVFPEQLEGAARIKVVFRDGLEHLLGQLHVAVLVVVVVVPVKTWHG